MANGWGAPGKERNFFRAVDEAFLPEIKARRNPF
jgi:hypothetical protein